MPDVDRPRYRTRKGHIATNVLGVCTHDLKFVYVLSGWEGSATDSRVLGDAVTRANGLKVPTGKIDKHLVFFLTFVGQQLKFIIN